MMTKNWLTPIIAAIFIFIVVRPTFAQIVERQANLAQYLSLNNVEVGIEVDNDYSSAFYVFEGQKTFVGTKNQNKRHVSSNGEYMVWAGDVNGVGQVFRYHIPTDTMIQITQSSTNLQPKVSRDGKVVWEGWVDENWQVFFFDGTKTTQLTSGDISINPDIDGDYISYGRKDVAGTWRSVVYSVSGDKAQEISTGISSKKPRVRNGQIILAGTGFDETFPLTVDDIFLLDLSPLSETPAPSPSAVPETVTTEEIIEELTQENIATESAEFLQEASSSANPTQ